MLPVTPSYALVFVGTIGLAYLLGGSEIRHQKSEIRNQQSVVSSQWSVVSSRFLAAAVCWLFFAEIGTAAWYRVHETNLVSAARWSVQWPEQAPNFHELKIDPEIRGCPSGLMRAGQRRGR